MRQKRKTRMRLVAQATNFCALVPDILSLIIAVFAYMRKCVLVSIINPQILSRNNRLKIDITGTSHAI